MSKMRLQLAIYRHALPPCNILFTTGSGPASHTASRTATISDLLADVNKIVPLESSDGEWCLEDYIVEVAATTDRDIKYECLHFSEVEKVLREDDEAVIRGLKNEELRERRLGGRFQITEDGRHLVDGIGWGKKWVRAEMGRPGIRIPGRKRRRLLAANGEDSGVDEVLAFTGGKDISAGVLAAFDGNDIDDDDEEDSSYPDEDGGHLQIMASANFEDADDEDTDDESSQDEDKEDGGVWPQLSDELRDLLAEAASMESEENTEEPDQEQAPTTSRSSKRKRDVSDDGDELQNESEFEGFSTPSAPRGVTFDGVDHASESDSGSSSSASSSDDRPQPLRAMRATADTKVAGVLRHLLAVIADGEDDDLSSSDEASGSGFDRGTRFAKDLPIDTEAVETAPSDAWETSSDDSNEEAESDADGIVDELKNRQTKKKKLSIIPEDGDDTNMSSASEDSSSDSEAEASSDRNSSSSAGDCSSDSSSSSGSSSEDQESQDDAITPIVARLSERLTTCYTPDGTPVYNVQSVHISAPPGDGLHTTRRRNERNKRKNRLKALKEEGVLPPDANFAAMAAYDQEQFERAVQAPPEVAKSMPQDQAHEDDVEEKKQELLQQLSMADAVEDHGMLLDHSSRNDEPSSYKRDIEMSIDDRNSDDEPRLSKEDHEILLDHPVSDDEPRPFIGAVRQDSNLNKEIIDTNVPPTIGTPTNDRFIDVSETKSEPPKKRAKLDIASSRRMLFGSLGLKAPKTAVAEQALREKLSQSVRKTPAKLAEEQLTETVCGKEQDRLDSVRESDWKNKLKVSAAECEIEGVKLRPPPFPFEQGWDKDAIRSLSKKKARNHQQYYQDYEEEDCRASANEEQDAPDVDMVEHAQAGMETPTVQSKTLSAESAEVEDLPRPADLAYLGTLDLQNAVPGAVIAFREWDINGNGEPVISDYRVARVTSVTDDGVLSLVLSKRDRDAAIRAKYDSVTGERLYSRFVVPVDEEDEIDVGDLTKPFKDLQQPKIIESSHIQVPGSNEINVLAGLGAKTSQVEDESVFIPDSGAGQPSVSGDTTTLNPEDTSAPISISTPRRNEITGIIKDAGFNSILDEQWIAPVNEGGIQDESLNTSKSEQVVPSSSQALSADIREQYETATLNETTGFENSHFNGWSSSPPREADSGLPADEVYDDEWQSSQMTKISPSKAKPPMTASQAVAYPNISQLDITELSVASNANSSSHQDAQRVGSITEMNISIGPSVDDGGQQNDQQFDYSYNDDAEEIPPDANDSLYSVIPPSEDNMDTSYLPSPQRDSAATNESFLGLGHDGHVSLGSDVDYNDNDGGSGSDSDLPSLHQITLSQVQRTRAASREVRVSPPPLKKTEKLRNGKNWKGKESSLAPDSSQSQPKIKVSASQREPRMSQIPEGTQVVDLTFPSDPVSSGGSDGEYRNLKGSSEGMGSRKVMNGRGKGRSIRTSSQKEVAAETGNDNLGLGLGRKRLLVSKKTKNRS